MRLMPALATTEQGLMRLLMDPIKLGLIGGAPPCKASDFHRFRRGFAVYSCKGLLRRAGLQGFRV